MAEPFENKILTCNKLAMDWLRKGNIQKSEEYISRAQKLLPSRSKSRQICHLSAITLNNLGCILKQKGNMPQALRSLEQALEYEENYSYDILNLAGIHLNISAIYSALNSHEISLRHALSAKKILLSKTDKDKTIWLSLAISYQAAGHEQECLSNFSSAKELYLKGWELAQEHLGPFHSVTEKIKKKYQDLQSNLKVKPKLSTKRSKTPSLLPKSSNISIYESKVESVKNKRNESRNYFNSILFVNEAEFAKSESSTEAIAKNDFSKAGQIKKLKFEKLPKLEENLKKIDKVIGIEVGLNDQDLKLETDEEYSDIYEELETENPKEIFEDERPDSQSGFEEVEDRDNGLVLNNEKLGISEKIEETAESYVKGYSEDIEDDAKGKSKSKDREIQTDSVMIFNKECQTESKNPRAFRRIAASIIQSFWKSYKKKKDPGYFEYLKEVQKAKIEADKAINKVNQIKTNYKSRYKKIEGPPLMKNKVIKYI